VFVFYSQAWYLAFTTASNQSGIVFLVKHYVFERHFETQPPKGQAYDHAIGAGTEVVQLMALYLFLVSLQLIAPHL
jgi:hypothetical protein